MSLQVDHQGLKQYTNDVFAALNKHQDSQKAAEYMGRFDDGAITENIAVACLLGFIRTLSAEFVANSIITSVLQAEKIQQASNN